MPPPARKASTCPNREATRLSWASCQRGTTSPSRSGAVGPPLVTTIPAPAATMPWGPIAFAPDSGANDASPVTTRRACGSPPPAPRTRVTAPVAPTHDGPSALSKQDAPSTRGPPRPASAT